MKVKIGIDPKYLELIAADLSVLLADEFVLYTKTRKAHWNVEGRDFCIRHKFFEEQYKSLDTVIDHLAERIRSIGHYASATLRDFLELTHLTEVSVIEINGERFIAELLSDHEAIIMNIRELLTNVHLYNKDAGTSSFITNLLEKHERMAWILRTHLKL